MTEPRTVLLRASSLGALLALVRDNPLDLDCEGPLRHETGEVTISALVTADDVAIIDRVGGIEVIDLRDRS